VFSKGHFDQRVLKVRLAGLFPPEPNLMEALPADAAAEMGMELLGGTSILARVRGTMCILRVRIGPDGMSGDGGYLNLRERFEINRSIMAIIGRHHGSCDTVGYLAVLWL
jgi:hypothetical protein